VGKWIDIRTGDRINIEKIDSYKNDESGSNLKEEGESGRSEKR